jgi:integration host factor subunit beta
MELTGSAIAEMLAERNVLPREQSEQAVDVVFDAIVQALSAGDQVALRGFGRFFLRPKRTPAVGRAKPGRAVAFQGAGRLMERINDGDPAAFSEAVKIAPPDDRRRESRQLVEDGTAIVRVSGIPVCEFKLQSLSDGGSSFWVRKDSFILRNIQVGQEIDIRIQRGRNSMFRARIAHISPADSPDMDDLFIMGVQTLGKLPME